VKLRNPIRQADKAAMSEQWYQEPGELSRSHASQWSGGGGVQEGRCEGKTYGESRKERRLTMAT
jgi:hypothetical protein